MLLSIVLLALATGVTQPGDTVRSATGTVWIEGRSNVASWSCRATKFDAWVDSTHVGVRVAVRDLKCGNRKMDQDLYAALKASDPKSPSWIVAQFAAHSGESEGRVEVAGIERVVTARIATELTAEGILRASGALPLLMTDFGVKPPVGLFGLIRSKNEITVKFELVMRASESGS
jgi:hypothetical protein